MKAIVNGFNDSTSKWLHYSFDLYLRYIDAFQKKNNKKLHISIFLHPFPPLFSHTLLPFLQNHKTTPDTAIQTQAFKKGKS